MFANDTELGAAVQRSDWYVPLPSTSSWRPSLKGPNPPTPTYCQMSRAEF